MRAPSDPSKTGKTTPSGGVTSGRAAVALSLALGLTLGAGAACESKIGHAQPHGTPGSGGDPGGGGTGNTPGAGSGGLGGGAPSGSGGGGGPVGSGGGNPTGGTGGGVVSGSGGMPPSFGTCNPTALPGITPLARLSSLQYRNTLRDLLAASGLTPLADEVRPMLTAVPDDATGSFKGLDGRISAAHVKAHYTIAAAVGNSIESNASRRMALAGACATAATLTAQCVNDFLASFGRRAFRRPLTADELTRFRALNDGVRPPAEAIRAMVVALLMSPRFVNHIEVDGAAISGNDTHLTLDAWETASRLSYTFWQTMPDQALLDAAASGALATTDGYNAQLDRVFADARTRETMWTFWNEWFRLESFTGFSAERPAFMALAAGENLGVAGHDHYGDMVTELRDLTQLFTWTRNGTLADLLTTDLSVTRSADLAKLYGVAAWSGSGEYPRLPAGTRAGLLQRGALLVSSLETTNPFHRGSFIRRNVLCDVLPQPNPNTLPPGSLDPPPPSPSDTTRQRFAKKVESSLCANCHAAFSDIGYVMESYDALGRHRTTEKIYDEQNGRLIAQLPVDSAGVPRIVYEDMRPVSGPAELNQRILESGKVGICLSGNYFRYALRREPTTGTGDACVYEELAAELGKPGVSLASVFKRLAQHPSFRQRKVGAP
jgi:hypothetical protein